MVRRRLLERLAGSWKVALLAAPAGYGKSTLAAQYAARRRVLWCRLDHEDRDLAHLFARFVAGGLRLRPPLTVRSEQLFRARRDMERDAGLLTASLLEELVPQRGSRLIVIEDLHALAGAREALGWLRRVMEESGPAVRYLLTCRGVCPVPLARFELQGGVELLGPEDLEFDETEQRLFLRRSIGRRLGRERAGALRASLRGWPAGFALLTGPGTGRRPPRIESGTTEEDRTRRLFRYLAEEVFSPLSVGLQADLCRASFLDDLEAPAVDFLIGKEAGARLRRELARRELLVRHYPDRREVPAFHPLFRDFLKERRAGLLPAVEIRKLGRRLARHLARRGEVARAIRVHLETDDDAQAIALFDRVAQRESPGSPRAALGPIALDILRHSGDDGPARRSPWLLSLAADAMYKEGRFSQSAELVEKAQGLWAQRGASMEIARTARLAAACAWVTGRIAPLVSRLEAYLSRCPKRERAARAVLMAEIGGLRLFAGQPRRARGYLKEAEEALRGTPHERQLEEIRLTRANLLYSQGHWDQYLEIAHRALGVFRRAGLHGRCQSLLINMAEAHNYLGEEDRALSLLDEAAALQPLVTQQSAALIELGRARAQVERGEFAAAAKALRAAREAARRHGSRLWEVQADLWAGVSERRRGRLDPARKLLSGAVEGFRRVDSPAWQNVAAMELGLVLGLLRQVDAHRMLHEAAQVSRRLGDAKELARNLLFQARVRQATGERFEPILRRALRLLERERYLVLLRKEIDVARPLLRESAGLPAGLRRAARAALPDFASVDRGPTLEVRLLGGMEVSVDQRPVSFPRRASMELVARLSLRPGEPIRREDLAESLWPGASSAGSRNRFDVALNGARRLLEPSVGPRGPFRVLESAAGWCRLAADRIRVDVLEFEAAAQRCEASMRELVDDSRGRRHMPAGSGKRSANIALRRAAAELSQAAEAYRGDLLPELAHLEWTERERERLRNRYHRILLSHAAISLRLGDAREAEADARRVLERDPMEETAQQTLLAVLAVRGDHLAVIRTYRTFARRVRRELGVHPSPETMAWYRASIEAARRSGAIGAGTPLAGGRPIRTEWAKPSSKDPLPITSRTRHPPEP